MSSTYTLLCLIDGDKNPFKVIIPIDSDIDGLKDSIKQKCSPMLEKFDAADLILWKVCYF
jgi:Crinkler effector protein N-terminal domain